MRDWSRVERLFKTHWKRESKKQNMKYLYVGMGSIHSYACTCGMEEGRRTRLLRLCETVGIETSSESAEAKAEDKWNRIKGTLSDFCLDS